MEEKVIIFTNNMPGVVEEAYHRWMTEHRGSITVRERKFSTSPCSDGSGVSYTSYSIAIFYEEAPR
jgi:hypothetical protein